MIDNRQTHQPMHRVPGRVSNYDKAPFVHGGTRDQCLVGWDEICGVLRNTQGRVIVVETYTGVHSRDLKSLLQRLDGYRIVYAAAALKSPREINAMVYPDVTDDPVFGRLTSLRIEDYFYPDALHRFRSLVNDSDGRWLVVGTGASLISDGDVLVYADMPRWEGQLRQRRGEADNLGVGHVVEIPTTEYKDTFLSQDPTIKYKRSFFVDWRVCDRLKMDLFERIDYMLDTTQPSSPKMIEGSVMRKALSKTARRPFRVVPTFDPAPWGGEWMKEVCDLDRSVVNFGWCFDCVPEENSLLLDFDGVQFETPAINLVLREPVNLLGDFVFERFGAEFPIRFDFLDTMGGGNLSLQVHPLTKYIREQFGMQYTQDESYYLLDAGADASVFLGLREGVDSSQMLADLERASRGGYDFPADKYVNRWPAKRHDHFLIPAGTVHCSGVNSMVLEISATPYIFTFKLWDWDRLGLNGRPRPIHLRHGANSIQWDRDTDWVKRELINVVKRVDEGDGWIQERTGLHELEFIETRRHWFAKRTPHADGNGVNVINLVEGEEAIVESPDAEFEPFIVHYAETFIVPAGAGPFTITPIGRRKRSECGTIKAFVRR